MAWPDGGTNPSVTTIGATGRNYETIAAWEADTDNDLVTGTVSPVGTCYADDVLAPAILLGATSNADYYRTLTVAAADRHDGTAYGGGATIVNGASCLETRELYSVVEWLLFTGSGDTGFTFNALPANAFALLRLCVIATTGANGIPVLSPGAGAVAYVENCVVHGPTAYTIFGANILTARNCTCVGGSYAVRQVVCVNTISVLATHCFWEATGNNNISGDTHDAGEDTVNSVTASNLLMNVGAGTEDLHLNPAGSEYEHASGAGADLSANFTVDIDGDTRIAWDIGADEYVAPPEASLPVARTIRRPAPPRRPGGRAWFAGAALHPRAPLAGGDGAARPAGRRGDALRVRFGGTELRSLRAVGAIPGTLVIAAAGANGPGTGRLRSWGDGTFLSWQAPGSILPGPGAFVPASGDYLLEDGADRSKWVRVRVWTASLVAGPAEALVRLHDRYGGGVASDDVAAAGVPGTTTWELTVANDSPGTLTAVRAWTTESPDLELSLDGETWSTCTTEAGALAVPDLAAGATDLLWVRRTIPAGRPSDPRVLNRLCLRYDGL